MRRVYYLACAAFGNYRIVSYSAEISAPPCTVPRRLVCGSVPYIRGIICESLFCLRVLLNSLNEDKSVRIYLQYGICALL